MAIYKNYPQVTTMENLQMEGNSSLDAVVKYGENVIAANYTYKGFTAAVYEFIETTEETGLGFIECRLSRIAQADKYFEDSGSAMLWGFEQLRK